MLPSPVSTILRAVTRLDDEPLNILTFPTHERYETNLCKTGHNFFAYWQEGIKDWKTEYAPVPENYTLLDWRKGVDQIPLHLDLDLILSQNKFGQFEIAHQISKLLGLPIISLEHTLPHRDWTPSQIKQMTDMKGKLNVFISEYSVDKWGVDYDNVEVVHHCVDLDNFCPGDGQRKTHLLSVVNDWINRDVFCGFNLWREVVGDKLPVRVVGDTQGLSQPAKNTAELIKEYQTSQVFLNTSLISPIPSVVLEAMACGCAVVSTATCMIPEIIEHGVNGYISNDPNELRKYCQELLQDPDKAMELGRNARKTIEEKFHPERFLNDWNRIFRKVLK